MRILRFLSLSLAAAMFFVACETEEETTEKEARLPASFSIELPSSISSGSARKSELADTLGGGFYSHLRTFVYVGQQAAKTVEAIMKTIADNNLSNAMSFTFTNAQDNRQKSVTIVEKAVFESVTYDFGLTAKDADGAIAFVVFWNLSPVKGVAILSPYDANRTETDVWKKLKYRVDYSEAKENGYDQQMTVAFSDYPVIGRYGLNNLKMFVGRKGDLLDIKGNSNHPDLTLILPSPVGFDWAFVARASRTANIAVAKVGLPPADYASASDIFEKYSLRLVLAAQFHTTLDPVYGAAAVEIYLQTALATAQMPAYFSNSGFVIAGPNPPQGFSSAFTDLSGLLPYIPNDIKNMKVNF